VEGCTKTSIPFSYGLGLPKKGFAKHNTQENNTNNNLERNKKKNTNSVEWSRSREQASCSVALPRLNQKKKPHVRGQRPLIPETKATRGSIIIRPSVICLTWDVAPFSSVSLSRSPPVRPPPIAHILGIPPAGPQAQTVETLI
jgi:hypothetical protein